MESVCFVCLPSQFHPSELWGAFFVFFFVVVVVLLVLLESL